RQRSLDFSLVDMPPSAGEQDLEYTQVLDDRMLLALPQNHPLAATENLQPAQLADQQWIAVIHNDDAHSRDDFVAACVRAGFNP
ncbi:LysR substrate-binding domain-containing protein, partial [Escherichia coli]|uniref:LysR substrate-binding domain-containing protein n=2 Tax=Enterobacteriaceae TaxID=543 RepID=UPI00207D6444